LSKHRNSFVERPRERKVSRAMTVKELARAMGYKAAALVELAKTRGIKLPGPDASVDAAVITSVRAQVPHRAKLSGPLLVAFTRIAGKAAALPAQKGAGSKQAPLETPAPSSAKTPPRQPKARVSPVKSSEGKAPWGGSLADALRIGTSKVAVDTSTLMMEGAIRVFKNEVLPALKAANCPLIVPAKVLEELSRHAARNDEHLSESGIRGLGILSFLGGEGLTEDMKSAADVHADEDLINLVSRYRSRFAVHVLTQDVALMVDIYALRTAESVREIKPIAVWEFRGGHLRCVSEEDARRRRKRQKES
jgi:rRNA-processing protein FCF1